MALDRLFPSIFAVALLAGCSGGDNPPPKVAYEGAGKQIQRVSARWGDTVEEQTVTAGGSTQVLRYTIVKTRKLTLNGGSNVTLHIDRDETFQTQVETFRCKASAEVTGTATYRYQAGEPEMRVSFPASKLDRRCAPPGVPLISKDIEATELVLVLRDDRLIGKGSPSDRTVLLPLQ